MKRAGELYALISEPENLRLAFLKSIVRFADTLQLRRQIVGEVSHAA